MKLPAEYRTIYSERREAIRRRLEDFSAVRDTDHFYELCFCILTPQSLQANAEIVIDKLKKDGFKEQGFDPLPYVSDRDHYIRFHNVKSARLVTLRDRYDQVELLLRANDDAFTKRELLTTLVDGIGLKEASHFLRNIGYRDLAILDRHILKHLSLLNVIDEIPSSLPPKKYYAIEKQWHRFASEVGIPLDELDLLFWSMETGAIKK